MDTQPKIPTLKDSQKPQVKVRGLEAGVTLFDRLKQFKKKDLAFILAGLGTLFMAPLAEHFMMSPETGDGTLQQGWKGGSSGGRGMFDGSGSSPYEPGTTGLAPGSAIGGGSDIITPLNVRDPSALVMGPGATQQPPTNSVMPSTPPPTAPVSHSDSDLKDALAASARGVTGAAHMAKALLPVPKIALSGGSGLRGLGVASGGSSASAGGGPISSAGLVTGKAANNGSMAGVRGGNNIKAVTRGQTSGDSGGMEALKKAGDAAGSLFNRGAASTALDNAAAAAIPTGGSSLGGNGPSNGATDKAVSGDSTKDSKSVGESLAFLKEKAMQEAQIALWAKEQEAGDNKLEALKIRNSMAETFGSTLASAAATQVSCLINIGGSTCPSAPGGVTTYFCNAPGAAPSSAPTPIPASTVGNGVGSCQGQPAGQGPNGAAATNGKLYYTNNSGATITGCAGSPTPGVTFSCTPNGSVPAGSGDPNGGGGGIHDMAGSGVAGDNSKTPVTSLGSACTAIQTLQTTLTKAAAGAQATAPQQAATINKALASFGPFLTFAGKIVAERNAIDPSGGAPNDCNAPTTAIIPANDFPLTKQLGATGGGGVVGDLVAPNQVLDNMDTLRTATDPGADPGLSKVANAVTATPQGVAARIDTFNKDVQALASDNQGLDYGTNATPGMTDPLGLTQLTASLKQSNANLQDPTLIPAAQKAEGQIQASAQTIRNEVTNLTAAAQLLEAQKQPLTDSFGDGTSGTLPGIIKGNGDLATAVKSTKPPLTPTPPAQGATPSQNPPAQNGSPIAQDLQAAQQAVTAAQQQIQTYNGTTPANPTVTSTTQQAIDAANKALATVQGDQKTVDDGIRQNVNNAAAKFGVGSAPAQ